jgi:perosamine synthetase
MIPYGKHHVDENDIKAVVEVLRSSNLTQGPVVKAFEDNLAGYVGAKYAVAVSSGTAALHLSMLAAGIRPGRTVITSPITFVATANAALYCGGSIAFADIDPGTINISPKSLVDVLTKRKDAFAVVPVHFAGLPCEMEQIKEIADHSNLVIIEDAAHALGASYKNGMKVGSCAFSLMTIFSFHPVKAISAGEGGMITTNDEKIYKKLLRLRSHGINKLDDIFLAPEQSHTDEVINPWYYEMQELGYHYRITDIQCALALSQLGKLDAFIEKRNDLSLTYDKHFNNSQNYRPAQKVNLFGGARSGRHIYAISIDYSKVGITRACLMKKLLTIGIGTQVHYIPVPMMPYYAKVGFNIEHFPNAAMYYEGALSIPLFYDLTYEQQLFVIDSLSTLIGS